MINSFLKWLIIMSLSIASVITEAHTYFFGLTDLSINSVTNNIEVIHQFTAHDLENAIAENKQINFSPEHSEYENYIQQYVEAHFELHRSKQLIKLNWVGFEIKTGKIFIYQEAPYQSFLTGIMVKNDLLVDTYPQQVNTMNYQDSLLKGTLTFSESQKFIKIEDKK